MKERGSQGHSPESKFRKLINRTITHFKQSGEHLTESEAAEQLKIRVAESQANDRLFRTILIKTGTEMKKLRLDESSMTVVQGHMHTAAKLANFQADYNWIMALLIAGVDQKKILKVWKQREKINPEIKQL